MDLSDWSEGSAFEREQAMGTWQGPWWRRQAKGYVSKRLRFITLDLQGWRRANPGCLPPYKTWRRILDHLEHCPLTLSLPQLWKSEQQLRLFTNSVEKRRARIVGDIMSDFEFPICSSPFGMDKPRHSQYVQSFVDELRSIPLGCSFMSNMRNNLQQVDILQKKCRAKLVSNS